MWCKKERILEGVSPERTSSVLIVLNYFKKALLYWLLSIIVLLITYYFFRDSQSKLLSIFFSFLAAITFPHTFVVSKIKKP